MVYDQKIPLNARTGDGKTPLIAAVQSGSRECLRHILRLVQDEKNQERRDSILNSIDQVEGNTALHVAIQLRNKLFVKQLSEAGARKDIKNKAGFTAAELAAEEENKAEKLGL